jgi:hypothetical protein
MEADGKDLSCEPSDVFGVSPSVNSSMPPFTRSLCSTAGEEQRDGGKEGGEHGLCARYVPFKHQRPGRHSCTKANSVECGQ